MSMQIQVNETTLSKMMSEFGKNLKTDILGALNPQNNLTFRQPGHEGQNDFNMSASSLFKVQGGNVLIIALGAAMAAFFAGLLNKLFGGLLGGISGTTGTTTLNLSGGIGKIITGLALKKFILKAGNGADFATGIFIAGVIDIMSGLVGTLPTFAQPSRIAGYQSAFGQPGQIRGQTAIGTYGNPAGNLGSVGTMGLSDRMSVYNSPGSVYF